MTEATLDKVVEVRARLLSITVWPALLIAVYVIILLAQIDRMRQASAWVAHTDQVIEVALNLKTLVLDSETGLRGFALTRQANFAKPYEDALRSIFPLFAELRELVTDNPAQRMAADDLHTVYLDWSQGAQAQYARSRDGGGLTDAVKRGELKAQVDRLRELFDGFIGVERRLRDARNRNTESATRLTITLAVICAGALAFAYGIYGRRQILAVTASFRRKIVALAAAREHLEERVRERTVELQKANEELEAFSYSVSHDLRAPLRSMEGFAAALADDAKPASTAERAHYLIRIRAGVARMGQVIEDLLFLSRITRTPIRPERVSISEIANEVIRELRADEPGRQVDVEVADGIYQRGDPDLTTLLVRNLLANAWKYTSRTAAPRIEVGSDDNGVFVRDNGVGFNMRYVDKIFQPFERLHSDEEFEGTGIGLAIAKRVIERHHGRIWAEAVVNEGATFHFTLLEPT